MAKKLAYLLLFLVGSGIGSVIDQYLGTLIIFNAALAVGLPAYHYYQQKED